MKTIMKLFLPLILVTVMLLALPAQAMAAQPLKLIIGGTFTLENGETLDEDLTVVGGTVFLEEGSTINGKIVVLGGSLEINGAVNGDVVAAGGYIKLGKNATVAGDITSSGGYVDRDQGAEIGGEIKNEIIGPFPLLIPGFKALPTIDISFSPFWKSLWFLVQVLFLSALGVLMTMFFPKQLERVSHSIATQPLISGTMGVLTGFIAPFVVVLLVITFCLIPAALLGVILLGVVMLLGWVSFGLEVGKRLGVFFKQEWAPPIAAGIGTFVLTLVVGGLGKIWCIGWIFPTVVAVVGLGAAILTRAGTQDYPETIPNQPPSPAVPVLGQEEAPGQHEEQGPGESI